MHNEKIIDIIFMPKYILNIKQYKKVFRPFFHNNLLHTHYYFYKRFAVNFLEIANFVEISCKVVV